MLSPKVKNIVVIGGGTGTYTVLSGLKKYTDSHNLSLSAVISVSDNGGSTGRLRDEFGILPVGDFRMALAALSDDEEETNNLLRDLFLYRFNKGAGLSGHNFGNLFLVALSDILGSEEQAIAFASKVLRVRGTVIPVSNDRLTLCAEYEHGVCAMGETEIDEPPASHDGTKRITKVWLEPDSARISSAAQSAIEQADVIVLGPGDVYTSIVPNLIVGGVVDALAKSPGKIVYILNLMSKYGQTHGFSAYDHARAVQTYLKRAIDCCIMNTTPLPEEVLERYRAQKEFVVSDDVSEAGHFDVLRGDFLASEVVTKSDGDVLPRSLIRHDSDKLARALITLV